MGRGTTKPRVRDWHGARLVKTAVRQEPPATELKATVQRLGLAPDAGVLALVSQ